MIVAITSENSGIEKTLIAEGLSARRAAEGTGVLLIDGDVHGTASKRAQERRRLQVNFPFTFRSVGGKGLAPELEYLSSKYRDIIIESESRDCLASRSALIAAQVAIVQVDPTHSDTQKQEALIDRIFSARLFNPRLRIIVAVTSDVEDLAPDALRNAERFARKIVAAKLSRQVISIINRSTQSAKNVWGLAAADLSQASYKLDVACLYQETFQK